MFEHLADILSIPDLCEALKIGKNTAYSLIKSGAVKSIKIGKKIKIPKDFLIEYVLSI